MPGPGTHNPARVRSRAKKPTQSPGGASAAPTKEDNVMFQVDQEIQKVRSLYEQLVGGEPPTSASPYAPIPPDADAETFVRQNLERLEHLLAGARTAQSVTSTRPSSTDAQLPHVTPPMNVTESDKAWCFTVDLCGCGKGDVSVEVLNSCLHVAAVRKDAILEGHRWTHRECAPS
jgi:HSP20 family molecular chaperone IbpA